MKWVKTKDALPEHKKLCIIRTCDEEYRVAKFYFSRNLPYEFIASHHDVYSLKEVTHWAELDSPKDI